MKVLVYTASSLCNPQFGIQIERALEYYHEGNEVVFSYCDGVMQTCSANACGNSAICSICKLGFKGALHNYLPNGIKKIGIKRICQRQKKKFLFESVQEIKNYRYKEVDVGFSVMSVYITKTRNPSPSINDEFLDCIGKMLNEAEAFVDSMESLILKETPKLIVFFNGRFYDTKPLHDLAIKYNIDFLTTENVGGVRAGENYKMVKFYNSIPHDAKVLYDCCLESWVKSSKSEEEKNNIGKSFYEKRRSGIKAGDYVYTGNQVKGLLPKTYDPSKKNIVVYCSSEDEYSSVSSNIDKLMLFNSQYEGIKYIVDNLDKEEYHLFVRIHPNMKGLNFKYHNDLYKLNEYENVTVIPPENSVSSYALMDVAYNIVVFGSTVGAESLYWGKPIVLLAFAEYYCWGCFALPKNKGQVVEMVKNPVVHPKAKEMAIKYGYYFLDNSLAECPKYVNITPKPVRIFGRRVLVFDYLRLLGSPLVYRFFHIFYSRILVRFHKNLICLPDKIIN